MTMQLTVFEISRCWKHPRGRYLIAAHSKKQATKLLGCTPYHFRNYHLEPCEGSPEYELAMSQPLVVFKQVSDGLPFKPITETKPKNLQQSGHQLSSDLKEILSDAILSYCEKLELTPEQRVEGIANCLYSATKSCYQNGANFDIEVFTQEGVSKGLVTVIS